MLKSCVLAGLDWDDPMMHLLLYITCSYIFHAYVPSILSILILLSLSLSLSPSSSLFVDSTPSHIWFRDEKAYTDFSENFS